MPENEIPVNISEQYQSEQKTIRLLYEAAQKLGADGANFHMNNIFHTKDLTATISVNIGTKPADMVLDELSDWAEEHDPALYERIQKLSQDMSWNKDNPV